MITELKDKIKSKSWTANMSQKEIMFANCAILIAIIVPIFLIVFLICWRVEKAYDAEKSAYQASNQN